MNNLKINQWLWKESFFSKLLKVALNWLVFWKAKIFLMKTISWKYRRVARAYARSVVRIHSPLLRDFQTEAFFIHTIPTIMHFVYVLYSLKDNRLYKGYTSNIQNRLLRHNSGGSTSTVILLKRINFTFPDISSFLFFYKCSFVFWERLSIISLKENLLF